MGLFDKIHNAIGDHHHLKSQILDDATAEVADLGSGGGGGVTVTVPPADPVAVTNIVAPGATIDGDTATLALLAQAIGPFAVSGTDADLAADWVKLTDLVEGSFVISVHVLCSVSFDGTGRLTVGVGNPAGGHDFAGIWTAAASPGPAAAGIAEVAASAPHGGLQSDPDGGLWATIDSVGSAGSADIYAIVAVPAS